MDKQMEWDIADAAMHSESVSRSPTGRPLVAPKAKSYGPPTTQESNYRNSDRNRQIALHHATIIQQRKNVETSVLQSTIALIDYPTAGPAADPAQPSFQDIAGVKHHLRHFQPSDYDALIAERNLEKKCGYVLCPRPQKEEPRWRVGRQSKFTILRQGGGSNELQIVETKDIRHWCSDDCARRAMYIRVQLSETPAWERQADGDLQLYGEEQMAQGHRAQADAVVKMTRDLKQLAIERGNSGADKMMLDVQENLPPHG